MITNKVFCIGLPRTGTTTFGSIMSQFGFRHKGNTASIQGAHFDDVVRYVDNMGYDSFDDNPYSSLWLELAEHYTDAKFVNLTRDPIKWRRSWMKLASNTAKTSLEEIKTKSPWRLKAFIDYLEDPTGILFMNRNETVLNYFQDSPNFIQLNWEYDDYRTLGKFLGVDKEIQMPHRDSFKTFNKNGLNLILQHFNQSDQEKILEFIK